jgi:hypothetical protein
MVFNYYEVLLSLIHIFYQSQNIISKNLLLYKTGDMGRKLMLLFEKILSNS